MTTDGNKVTITLEKPDVVPWKTIRSLSEDGFGDKQLAGKFGVTEVAIRSRRCRELWFASRRKEAAFQAATSCNASKIALENPPKASISGKSPDILNISAIKAAMHAENILAGQQMMVAKSAKRMQALELDRIPIQSMGDVKNLYEVFHKAAGLDKPTVQVNQIFSDQSFEDYSAAGADDVIDVKSSA